MQLWHQSVALMSHVVNESCQGEYLVGDRRKEFDYQGGAPCRFLGAWAGMSPHDQHHFLHSTNTMSRRLPTMQLGILSWHVLTMESVEGQNEKSSKSREVAGTSGKWCCGGRSGYPMAEIPRKGCQQL